MSSFEIMTPPTFDLSQLHIGTGHYTKEFVIRVTRAPCVLGYEIRVPNPTWLTLALKPLDHPDDVASGGGFTARGNMPVEEPGQYRLVVSINSDSQELRTLCAPGGPGHLKGDFLLMDTADPENSTRKVGIRIQSIRPMSNLEGFFSLDLGTTNSTAVYFDKSLDGQVDTTFSPIEIDFSTLDNMAHSKVSMNTIPTDLFINDPLTLQTHPAASLMGEAAQNLADDAEANLYDSCFVRGAKSVIATDALRMVYYKDSEGYITYKEFAPYEILEAIIRKLLTHCSRQMKKRLTSVIMTYPPQWSFVERRALERIFEQLQPAIKEKRGQLKIEMSIDEASAAGLYYCYEQSRKPGFFDRISAFRIETPTYLKDRMRKKPDIRYDSYRLKTMAFDFGGGSLDLSLIQYDITRSIDQSVTKGAPRTRVRVKLLDADSLLHHGGNYITLRLFRLLKRRIALAVAEPIRVLGEMDEEEDLERYREPSMADMDEISQQFHESPAFQAAKNSLVARWDQVAEATQVPTLQEMVERLKNHDEDFDYPRAFEDPELEAAIERILPTRWDEYTEGSEEQISAKRNFRILWRAADEAKKELVNGFNRELGQEVFQAEDFEEKFGGFGKVRSIIPGEEFPHLKGLIPYERSPEIRKRSCSVSLADVFLASSPLVAQGIRMADDISRPHQGDLPQAYNWVVLAGNSSRSPLVRYLFIKLAGIVDPSQIKGNVKDAKVAVAKGACTNLIIRQQIPGLEFETHGFATKVPRDLWLLWGGGQRKPLFSAGPLDELRYAEYELGRMDADYVTITQASLAPGGKEEVAGRIPYKAPGTEGYPSSAIWLERSGDGDAGPRPLHERFQEEYGYVPRASELRAKKESDDLDAICPGCTQMEATYGTLLNEVLQFDFEEVIRWCEEESGPLPGNVEAVQRFYLSREMKLFMVEHTSEGKVLLSWENRDIEGDEHVRQTKKLLDPFSGVH